MYSVAIVTASTEGIGLAIARKLAIDGAKVMISSRKVRKRIYFLSRGISADLQDANKKLPSLFFCLLLLMVHLHNFSKIKSHKEFAKQ
jgi:NAD(P)-dependent dehydrogenase (short-subunit alcohol dehydrogenase family)